MGDKTLTLVDCYGLFFRAYYALPNLTTREGVPIGAVQGFILMLLNLLHDDGMPQCIGVALDAGGRNTFRHHMYPHYKAHRSPTPPELQQQLCLIPEILDAFGVPCIRIDNFEADDCIATAAHQAIDSGMKVIVVSGDKDLLQLVTEDIKVFDPIKNHLLDADGVLAKMGVKPTQVVDYLSLVGDQSDNIPGAKGIGPKTAQKLLQEFGSLNGIYDNIAKVPGKTKEILNTHRDQVMLSQELVDLRKDIVNIQPTSELLWQGVKGNCYKLLAFLQKYDLQKIHKKIAHLLVETNNGKSGMAQSDSCNSKLSNISQNVNKSVNISEFVGAANSAGWLAADLIGHDLFFYTEVVQIHVLGNADLDPSIAKLLADDSITKICIDAIKLLRTNSALIAKWNDLSVMHYICDTRPNLAPQFNGNFYQEYKKMLSKLHDCRGLYLYFTIDRYLAPILHSMEKRGIMVDTEYLHKLGEDFRSQMQILEQQIYIEAGQEFNLASPKQVAQVLFDKLNLHLIWYKHNEIKNIERAKYPSTNAEVLDVLSMYGYNIAKNILNWRQLSKLVNTYINGLLAAGKGNSDEIRIHCQYHATSIATGRISTSNPNLQSIPIRTTNGSKIREAFIAKKDHQILDVDYSQIEIRILAHIANVETMCTALLAGQDIHSLTASQIFKMPLLDINPDHRRFAKTINFGIIYGMSSFGLSKSLNIGIAEAESYIQRYFATYPGIREYMEITKEYAKKNGYVETIFGRKCYIENAKSPNKMLAQVAMRAAINAPIQGSAADIIRKTIVDLPERAKQYLLLQIHDELLFEIPNPRGKNTSLIPSPSGVKALGIYTTKSPLMQTR